MSRQYISAAAMVEEVVEKGGNLKKFCSKAANVGKVDFALANETLKFKGVLDEILQKCNISAKSLDVRQGLLLVMLYELLLGHNKISGGGSVKRKILEHEVELKQHLAILMQGKSDKHELLPQNVIDAMNLQKFVRVNEVKLTIDEGLAYVQRICPEAVLDNHIPSVIVLPPKSSSFGQDEYVREGKLIIQDKASCFPSQVMADEWTAGNVIDACAAPGNKTSHLAALMKKKISSTHLAGSTDVTLFAMDKSVTRSKLLSSRMTQAGVDDIVTVINTDFLSTDTESPEFAAVQSVMLDPSCSGSGVVRCVERLVERERALVGADTEATSDRLEQLSSFQLSAILKAATFPNVRTIVYSTCSTHSIENEEVVTKALSSLSCEGWELHAPKNFSTWPRRGLSSPGLTAEQSRCLIRCSPTDGMNGFFVALFKRSKESTIHRHLGIDAMAHSKRRLSSNGCSSKSTIQESGDHTQKRHRIGREQNEFPILAAHTHGSIGEQQQHQAVITKRNGPPSSLFGRGSRFQVKHGKRRK